MIFGGLKCKNPDDKSEFVMYGIWKPRLDFQEMDKRKEQSLFFVMYGIWETGPNFQEMAEKKELSLFFGNNGHVLRHQSDL